MRKFNLFAVCALLCMSFALCGCEKYQETTTIIVGPNDETPNLTYTLWQGTVAVEATEETLPVSISFSADAGYYYLDGEPYDFKFDVFGESIDQCALRISAVTTEESEVDMLVGFWWVMEWTDDALVLESQPFDENNNMVMQLSRVR